MVCAEDVVSYFRTLKSYERIGIMCTLQHCCLPFELRFFGTCLEELGKKDYHELRQAENEANSNADVNLSELRKISDKRVQNKIILNLSLLHSRNYSCSNSLYKILCDCEEVNAFLKCETSSTTATTLDEEDCFEHLLMIYTLAVNHPAFSSEQKQTLQNIFEIIRAEESKRKALKQNVTPIMDTVADGITFNTPIQLQECQPHMHTLPENAYTAGPHHLSNASHLPAIAQPFPHDLSIPMTEPMSIGLPPPNFVRFPFAAAAWNAGIPIVFTTTEPTSTTSHSFMSRSSSPSLSNSPSRSSSPSTKVRPLSAPFARSPQITGPVLPQPTSLPLPQTSIDPFAEGVSKDASTALLSNFASEQLYRLSDEELTTLGMTDESIQQLRCMVIDKRPNNDELIVTHPVEKSGRNVQPEVEIGVANSGLMYTTSMAVPGPLMPTAASHQCPYCQAGAKDGRLNGFVPEMLASSSSSCIDHDISMLRLESDGPSQNSNSSNSEGTSSDQSSPPNTPILVQNNYNKRNNKSNVVGNDWNCNSANNINNNNISHNDNGGNGGGGRNRNCESGSSHSSNCSSNNVHTSSNNRNNVHNNNVNVNADERSNAGDSSSEEKNYSIPTTYQGRVRVVNSSSGSSNGSRGRSKNTNSYSRGRGNHRRRSETANGNNEDVRKTTPQFAVANTEAAAVAAVAAAAATPFQYPGATVTATTVTNATYLPPHLIRSYGSFPANSYIRPPYPATFAPSGEILYHHHHHHHHQYPPPPPPPPPPTAAAAFLPGPLPYGPIVSPKLSCYNCGSQNHQALDCTESTLEEASKQGQYRLDYTPSTDGSYTTEK